MNRSEPPRWKYAKRQLVELVKSAMIPEQYKMAPPMPNGEITYTQSVEVTGNFPVTTPAGQEMVPSSSGMVVWFPWFNLCKVIRFGFVPSGAASSAPVVTMPAPFISQLWTSTVASVVGGAVGGVQQFATVGAVTFNSQVALPYNTTPDQVQVGLPETDYVRIRTFAGKLSLISDTANIGSITINGSLSGAAIGSVLDAATPNNARATFDPLAMANMSVTGKDAVKEVTPSSGVTAILGADYAPEFTGPGRTFDEASRGWTTNYVVQAYNALLDWPSTPASQPGDTVQLFGTFISPYDITMALKAGVNAGGAFRTQAAGQPVQFSNFQTPRMIDPLGTLKFDITFPFSVSSNQNSGLTYDVQVVAEHIFGSINGSTGAVAYVNSPQTKSIYSNVDYGATGYMKWRPVTVSFDAAEAVYADVGVQGVYLGTCISCIAVGGNDAQMFGAPYLAFSIGLAPAIKITSNTDMRTGYNGPARVLRWDNLSIGAVVKLAGTLNFQAQTNANIVPYQRDSTMMGDAVHQLNAVTCMQALWNGPGPFCRIYNTRTYDKFCDKEIVGMTCDSLRKLMDMPKIATALDHAGLNAGVTDEQGLAIEDERPAPRQIQRLESASSRGLYLPETAQSEQQRMIQLQNQFTNVGRRHRNENSQVEFY